MSEVSAPLFSVTDLKFRYGRPLFQKLNFSLQRGECFGVLGPSGEGKSTFLKLLVGLLRPQAGSVKFEGKDWRKRSRADRSDCLRRIGMTLQRTGLFDSMTCGENLTFPLIEVGKMAESAAREKMRTALAEVGLAGIEDKRTHEISGGMQKRLGIARALILQPEIILLDEPTAGLDPVTSRAISELIGTLKDRYGMTVVFVSSDLAQVFQLATRVGFLTRGEFIQVGTVPEIKNSSNEIVRHFVRGTGRD